MRRWGKLLRFVAMVILFGSTALVVIGGTGLVAPGSLLFDLDFHRLPIGSAFPFHLNAESRADLTGIALGTCGSGLAVVLLATTARANAPRKTLPPVPPPKLEPRRANVSGRIVIDGDRMVYRISQDSSGAGEKDAP